MTSSAAGNTTAHTYWNETWQTAAGVQEWSSADPWVLDWLARARARGARHALDLGCGPGRHALAMAAAGLDTVALDASPTALNVLDEQAARQQLVIRTLQAPMDHLPLGDASLDLVLAFNVVYHGDRGDAGRTLAEIVRVLRPGGIYLSTMLSKRHQNFGRGTRIAPDTFVDTAATAQPGVPDDKSHPHLYCNATDLVTLHAALAPLSLDDREQRGPGTQHWYCAFERE